MRYRSAARSAPELQVAACSWRGYPLSGRVLVSTASTLLVAVASLAGCSRPPEGELETLEIVDVTEGVDSQIRPEDDIQAELLEREFLGVLPGGFPSDFWVYSPGSIVDLESDDGDRGIVALRTFGSVDDVRRRLIEEERARGWQESGVGSALLSFTKEGRRIDLALEARGNETWMRIEY